MPFRPVLVAAVGFGLAASMTALPGAVAQAVPAPTVALPTLSGADPVSRTAVAFDVGQLLVDTRFVSTQGELQTWPVIDVPTSSVDLGFADLIESDTAASSPQNRRFAVSGDLVVATTADLQVHVTKRGYPVFTVPAPTSGLNSVDASGPYVRIGTKVYDTRRSGTTPVYTGSSSSRAGALFGSYVGFGDATGRVLLKNVASSAASVVANPGTPGCLTCTPVLRIDGGTVASGRADGSLTLYGIASKVTTANALSLGGATNFWLGNGKVLVAGASGVDVYSLATTATLNPSGFVYLAGSVLADLDIDGNDVAYVLADGTGYVAHLPPQFDGPKLPALLTARSAAAISPNGDGVLDSWRPSIYFTRALTSYSVTIKNSANTVVSASTTAVVDGSTAIAPIWAPTSAAKDGLYTWTVVASSIDGAGAPVVGSVRVRRTNAQKATAGVPLNVATASRSVSTTLTWRSLGGFPSGVVAANYDVAYRQITISKKKRVYGPTKTLRSKTTKRGTTFKGAKGATYQFRVRARDSVGLAGPWTAWKRSNTPLDDRAAALKYSRGWAPTSSAASWAGTRRSSSKAGRTVSLTSANAGGFALVMTRCKKCGAVKVFVDGKLRKTVSLYSSSTKNRRQVYSVSFSKLGKHSIKVVTVTKKKRARADLDAVLVRH